jgi:hypothetical protein
MLRRTAWGWILHGGLPRVTVSIAYRPRRPWGDRDFDIQVPETVGRGLATRRLALGRLLIVVTYPWTAALDCAGPVRDVSGVAFAGEDNDSRDLSPWAELDGATAAALDGLRPGHARTWWGACLDRAKVDRGWFVQRDGLRHELKMSDGTWFIRRLPVLVAS